MECIIIKNSVVDIVDHFIDKRFVNARLIRFIHTKELLNDPNIIGQSILDTYTQFGSLEKAIMPSLYMWHACIGFDKLSNS